MNTGGVNSKLDMLRRKEAALREAIAAEKVKQQKRREKDHDRLVSVVGQVVLSEAERTADFELMLKQIMQTAHMDERSRQFLTEMGWL